jgi:hypothetical protein
MISGLTSNPLALMLSAASMIALVYISVISGYVIPNLHPLCPNIGLNSANS